jgi:hypothetical protein
MSHLEGKYIFHALPRVKYFILIHDSGTGSIGNTTHVQVTNDLEITLKRSEPIWQKKNVPDSPQLCPQLFFTIQYLEAINKNSTSEE